LIEKKYLKKFFICKKELPLTYRKQQSNRINLIKMTTLSNSIKAFQIFKAGTTSTWTTILIPQSQFNNEILQKKISWYLYLGYQVKNI